MSSQNQLLLDIYKDSRTVFTMPAIALSPWAEKESRASLLQKLNYYARNGSLLNLRRGLYAKKGYRPEEVACSLFAPSYLSLEYVLQRSGVVFQYDEALSCVSYLSRSLEIEGREYGFRKIKNGILIDNQGIVSKGNLNIATAERAFLDMVYLESSYHFDNPSALDKEKVYALLPIYNCRKMEKRVAQIIG